MDNLTFSVLFAITCLVLASFAKVLDKRISLSAVVLCATYLGLDDFMTGLPGLIKGLSFIGVNWNWSGKILSLTLSVVVLLLFRLSPDAVGLRLEQGHRTLAWAALAGFTIWGAALGLVFKPGAADAETLAFQATMPGLAEELAYRGIAPVLLLGLFNRKPHVDGIPWAIIISTAIMFGSWHSLSYSNGKVGFNLMSGLFPFIGSVPGGWLRFKTRSLLVPVLGHSLANVAFHIAGKLGG